MLAAYVVSILVFPKPGGRIVFGDATHLFVQLRSLVFDRDLDFRNEYVRIYGLRGGEFGTEWVATELTPTGHVRNYMPIGPALLWVPLYLVVAGVETLLAWMGLAAWPDGFDSVLQAVAGLTGVVAATIAAWLSWRLARRHTDATSAAVGTFAVWLGSSAVYYSLISPSYSHAASMLTSAIFFWYWMSTGREASLRRSAALGALAGLAALMRWQDAIFLSVPILDALLRPASWRSRVTSAGAAAVAWVAAFSPQMAVWQVLYGKPFAVPQGASFLQWTQPHVIEVLLSDNHGLFSWTPLLLLSVAGLAVFSYRRRALALPLTIVLLASWYINAAVADWWAGEAFGARRFLSLFPLFVLGLAVWVQPPAGAGRVRVTRIVLALALVALNVLLLFQYELFMKGLRDIAPYPRGWFDLWVARFVVPFRLLVWWLG